MSKETDATPWAELSAALLAGYETGALSPGAPFWSAEIGDERIEAFTSAPFAPDHDVVRIRVTRQARPPLPSCSMDGLMAVRLLRETDGRALRAAVHNARYALDDLPTWNPPPYEVATS